MLQWACSHVRGTCDIQAPASLSTSCVHLKYLRRVINALIQSIDGEQHHPLKTSHPPSTDNVQMKERGGFGRITVGLTLDPHYARVFPICVNSARSFITLNASSHVMGLSSKLMSTGVSPPLSPVTEGFMKAFVVWWQTLKCVSGASQTDAES